MKPTKAIDQDNECALSLAPLLSALETHPLLALMVEQRATRQHTTMASRELCKPEAGFPCKADRRDRSVSRIPDGFTQVAQTGASTISLWLTVRPPAHHGRGCGCQHQYPSRRVQPHWRLARTPRARQDHTSDRGGAVAPLAGLHRQVSASCNTVTTLDTVDVTAMQCTARSRPHTATHCLGPAAVAIRPMRGCKGKSGGDGPARSAQ